MTADELWKLIDRVLAEAASDKTHIEELTLKFGEKLHGSPIQNLAIRSAIDSSHVNPTAPPLYVGATAALALGLSVGFHAAEIRQTDEALAGTAAATERGQ